MIDKNIETITVNICSYGGEEAVANTIVDSLQTAKEQGIKIITNAFGSCCSGACDIFLIGDERNISRRCYFLVHNTQLHVEDSVDNIKNDIAASDIIVKELLKLLLDDKEIIKKGIVDEKYFMDKIKGKDWILSPKECKRIGFAHNYITEERRKNGIKRKINTKK